MHINQRRILSPDYWLNQLKPGTKFKVSKLLSNLDAEMSLLGFNKPFVSGATILPSVKGPVSRFNAEGRYKPLKDLPKENRYIYTLEWTWNEKHGDKLVEQSGYKDICRMCYQREFIPPPAVELTFFKNNSEDLIVSEEFTNNEDSKERVKHTINLLLEKFGECDIRHTDLQAITLPTKKKVNWTILPPGKYPWSKVREHMDDLLVNKAPRTAKPILARQLLIETYKPDEVYVGQGGFRSYVAYIFKDKGITVLESTKVDNATYIFTLEWEEVSKLTKAEILQNNFQKDRLIHSTGWSERILDHIS